jgi:hypothetical protein
MFADAVEEATDEGIFDDGDEEATGADSNSDDSDTGDDDDSGDPHDKNFGLRYPEDQHALMSKRIEALVKAREIGRAALIFGLVEEAYNQLGVQ